jgi:adenylylsulfate kinase
MIWWIYGSSGSGKTTLAQKILDNNPSKTIHLDGDELRATISRDLGFSEEDRKKHNKRVAYLAKLLDSKGFDVVVSTICPYKELREEIYWICKCRFIKVEGGFSHET